MANIKPSIKGVTSKIRRKNKKRLAQGKKGGNK